MRRDRRTGHATLERIDGEAVHEMTQGRGWKLLVLRLRAMREQKLRELVAVQTELATATLRGSISTLDTILKLPDILDAEAKKETHARIP